MAARLLEHFKNKIHESATDVKTAATKIIKSGIRKNLVDKSTCPSLDDMRNTDYERMGSRELKNISWTSFSFKAERVKFQTVH